MTDEELWEWMQRDLDNDLSAEEKRLLYTLLEKEPALKQKYERLKRVSQELEKLPSVTPPYSIVDTILPRLKQEAAVRGAGEAERKEEDQTAKVLRIKPRQADSERRRPAFATWLVRAGSAAVAVCLFFGVLVISQEADRKGEDVSRSGANLPSPQTAPSAVYGPVLPPSTPDPAPDSTPAPSTDPDPQAASKEAEEKKNEAPPTKEPVQQKVTQTGGAKPVPAPGPSLDTRKVNPSFWPLPPALRSSRQESFPPYGVKEKRDEGNRQPNNSKWDKKERENNGKEKENNGKDRGIKGKDKGKEPNPPKWGKEGQQEKNAQKQKKNERDPRYRYDD